MSTKEIEKALLNLNTEELTNVINRVLEASSLVEEAVKIEKKSPNDVDSEVYILSHKVLAEDWESEADSKWDNYEEYEQEKF